MLIVINMHYSNQPIIVNRVLVSRIRIFLYFFYYDLTPFMIQNPVNSNWTRNHLNHPAMNYNSRAPVLHKITFNCSQ